MHAPASPCCGAAHSAVASVVFELLAGCASADAGGPATCGLSHSSHCKSIYASCQSPCLYSQARRMLKKGSLKRARKIWSKNQRPNSEQGASSSVATPSQKLTFLRQPHCCTVVCQCAGPCWINQSFVICKRASSASVASSPQASDTANRSSSGMREMCFEHHWSMGRSP